MKTKDKILVHVEDYYQDELFKYIPEDMFDILDEAYFYKKEYIWIPRYLIEEFNHNKNKTQ